MPQVYGEKSKKRQECVVSLRDQGLSLAQVGDNCGGISRQAIDHRLRYQSKRPEILRRHAGIAFLFSLGWGTLSVAEECSMDPSNISLIAKKYNLRKVRYERR